MNDNREMGENSGQDMRRSFARHTNRIFSLLSNLGASVELGPEGEVPIKDVRFRDDEQAGHLRAYIRKEIDEHPGRVITVSVVSLGIVAAGIYKLKHRNDK